MLGVNLELSDYYDGSKINYSTIDPIRSDTVYSLGCRTCFAALVFISDYTFSSLRGVLGYWRGYIFRFWII